MLGVARRVQFRKPVQTSRRPRIVKRARRRASLTAVGAFWLVSLLDEPTALDRAVYDWARRRYDRRLELAQLPLEVFGLPGLYLPTALLIAQRLRRKARKGGATIVRGALGGWLAVRASRLLFHRPRPPRPPHRKPKSESTFPSGHTAGVTAFALTTAGVLRDEQILNAGEAALLGIGLPLLMGLNRVYVREHWLTDVLGAWALGGSVALMALATLVSSSARPSLPFAPLSSPRVSSFARSVVDSRAIATDTSSPRSRAASSFFRSAGRPSGPAACACDRRA